jgi:hypothetical protein
MRNCFALSFLWLSLAFLPIACNPKSDDRGARGNSSQPKNNTGTPDSLGVNVTGLNSGGGATFTFKPDPSGNTASYLLTITDAAGEDTVTSVCADSIFNCAFFEKATSIKTSNCNSEGNCSAATEVDSIPTCDEDGEFSGKVNEIVSDLQTLAQQERNLAEEFIECDNRIGIALAFACSYSGGGAMRIPEVNEISLTRLTAGSVRRCALLPCNNTILLIHLLASAFTRVRSEDDVP